MNRVTAEVRPHRCLKSFEKGFLFLEVLIQTDKPLGEVWRHAAVTFREQ